MRRGLGRRRQLSGSQGVKGRNSLSSTREIDVEAPATARVSRRLRASAQRTRSAVQMVFWSAFLVGVGVHAPVSGKTEGSRRHATARVGAARVPRGSRAHSRRSRAGDRPIRLTSLPPIPHLDPLQLSEHRHNNLLDETPQLSPKALCSPPETTPDMGGGCSCWRGVGSVSRNVADSTCWCPLRPGVTWRQFRRHRGDARRDSRENAPSSDGVGVEGVGSKYLGRRS